MQPALYYEKLKGQKVVCRLCPHECSLAEGKTGVCKVRTNVNGALMSENYGKLCSMRFDPIEKKPLYHFYPGSLIYSVGSVGCNLSCKFCQNWEISQTCVRDYPYLKEASPDKIVNLATVRGDNIGIAYTYNEPTVWFEFMLETARLAKERGLKNVAVTNGFINHKPLAELLPFMDAFNVDLKGFTEKFYKKISGASLKPVLDSIKLIKKNKKHLELTNLLITDLNDDENDFRRMLKWIAEEVGKETPLHISRYFPVYKLKNKATSVTTLLRFHKIAKEYLDHVYVGNIMTQEGQHTHCPGCGKKVIERNGYSTYRVGIDKSGNCKYCKAKIIACI